MLCTVSRFPPIMLKLTKISTNCETALQSTKQPTLPSQSTSWTLDSRWSLSVKILSTISLLLQLCWHWCTLPAPKKADESFLDISLLSLYTQRCLAQPAQHSKLSLDLCPKLSLVRKTPLLRLNFVVFPLNLHLQSSQNFMRNIAAEKQAFAFT